MKCFIVNIAKAVYVTENGKYQSLRTFYRTPELYNTELAMVLPNLAPFGAIHIPLKTGVKLAKLRGQL